MEIGVVIAAGILLIALSSGIGTKVRVAPQLLLLGAGILLSFMPWMPHIAVHPEIILELILPPLLYGSAVSVPSMDFRREFRSISMLAVGLVVVSALLLGLLFTLLIPGLSYGWGVALGAIVSPTDAVATSIAKNTNLSSRVIAILEGESLLNDASALVVLRTAIAGTAAAVSIWGMIGTFIYSAGVAVIIGVLVGWGGLRINAFFKTPTVNAVLSLAWPFVASIPTTLVGASGLVAAVSAGLVRGFMAPRMIGPWQRRTTIDTWATLILLLESAVFLIMGLELATILDDVRAEHESIIWAISISVIGLVAALVLRGICMLPLFVSSRRSNQRRAAIQPRVDRLSQVDQEEIAERLRQRGGIGSQNPNRAAERFSTRIRRLSADIRYFVDEPLGWRELSVVTWGGMRGVVTLAAAQTLPDNTPYRSLLVLVAFFVASISLVVQGGLLEPVLRLVKPAGNDLDALQKQATDVRDMLRRVKEETVNSLPDKVGKSRRQITILNKQRDALLDARDDGLYSAQILERALANIDAAQISLEFKAKGEEQNIL